MRAFQKYFQKNFRRAGEPLPVRVHHLDGDRYRVEVGGEVYELSAVRKPDGGVKLELDRGTFDAYCAEGCQGLQVRVDGRSWNLQLNEAARLGHQQDDGAVEAPMTGTVLKVLVQPGETVRADQSVVLLTAMKMEHSLEAGTSGVVAEVNVEDGQAVEQGSLLIRIENESGAREG